MEPESLLTVVFFGSIALVAFLHQWATFCPKNPMNGAFFVRLLMAEHCDHRRHFNWNIKHGTHDEPMVRAINECCWCKRRRNNFDDMRGVDYNTLNWVDQAK